MLPVQPLRPRRLLTAYFLWLFCPLVWPGAYLFYLGRDTHAWLQTVSFGGFGIGWLLDLFYIPLYVADHNEPMGYFDRVEKRNERWYRLSSLLAAPFTLLVRIVIAVCFGVIGAYLVPRPLVLPSALGVPPLTKLTSAAVGHCVGMLCVAVALHLTGTRLGRTRTACRWRPVLIWTALCSAVLAPNLMEQSQLHAEDFNHVLGFVLGALGVLIGTSSGRYTALERSPRRCTQRRSLSVRLLVHWVGVAAVAGAAVGAFHLNGSFTHTDQETGVTTRMSGPEALSALWRNAAAFSGELGEALGMLRERHKGKTWPELWLEFVEAFRDPSAEAAAVLGVSVDASAEEVKRAHRNLARLNHPDKVEPERQDEAKQLMQKINWAKEVLTSPSGERRKESFE